MGGVYKDCGNCEIRKAVARSFDLHWLGEDDCPFTCPADGESKQVGILEEADE